MHIRPRSLLFALGALLLPALSASAQFVELVTEAPVTVTGSITTTKVTATATSRTTTATVTTLQHPAVVADLLAYLRAQSLVAPDDPSTGWTLVTVNYAPADLAYVDARGTLYLVNTGISKRVRIPDAKFAIDARLYKSVAKYTEHLLGRYVLDSAGTVTNHVSYNYLPSLTAGGLTYNVTNSVTDGFATINYKSKDSADGFEVFFLAINSMKASVRGSFTAETKSGDTVLDPTQGLISLSVVTSAAKLVPASNYPEVSTFPEDGF